jgi:hypothetical protein
MSWHPSRQVIAPRHQLRQAMRQVVVSHDNHQGMPRGFAYRLVVCLCFNEIFLHKKI